MLVYMAADLGMEWMLMCFTFTFSKIKKKKGKIKKRGGSGWKIRTHITVSYAVFCDCLKVEITCASLILLLIFFSQDEPIEISRYVEVP